MTMRRPPVPPPPLLLWAALLGLAQAARCHTSVGDAQWLCRDGGSTIADSLRSVGLGDDSDSSGSELHELLHENGLRTATDLRLLAADGVEAAELMEQLRGGGISIGDRSKVRLLLGGGERSVSCGTESPRSVTPVTGSADAGGWHSSRQLQGASGGMSADTIAIVLSVLVGAAGYLVQAYTAQREERSSVQRAQELHTQEQARQREHEQMLAQIARTDRAVDDCCGPIQASLDHINNGRYIWVGCAVTELELAAPEVVTHMLGKCTPLSLAVNDKGQALSTRSGKVYWDPAARPDGITRVHDHNPAAFESAAAFVIAMADSFILYSQPYCSELPTGLRDYLAADPTTPLARRFRFYVRHCLLPTTQRVQELLNAHGAVVETPPRAWMDEHFPAGLWYLNPTRMFRTYFQARAQAWEAQVAEWDGGDLGSMFPPGDFAASTGLAAITEWAIARGHQRQRELIGMTAQAEVPVEAYGDRTTISQGREEATAIPKPEDGVDIT